VIMRTYALMKEFADSAVADGLTLLQTYKLRYSSQSGHHITTTEWNVAFEAIRHNQQLDRSDFVAK
jgi:hypothetical protein